MDVRYGTTSRPLRDRVLPSTPTRGYFRFVRQDIRIPAKLDDEGLLVATIVSSIPQTYPARYGLWLDARHSVTTIPHTTLERIMPSDTACCAGICSITRNLTFDVEKILRFE